VRIFKTKR